ncbi:MAG TPA: N-acetyl-gamma-glutamyl-phosphate reductase [Ferruginibacter sp.]|jgi:N-acetyl-gamma-glutamyl-phosphate reductase|nr:N-acetyl-gamma-glutamyl-phosphate reductase [Ferruginibacter sp.]
MAKIINVGIIGAAGYTGGELIRLLLNHPNANIFFAQSGSNAGNLVSKIHADLVGETDLKFSAEHNYDVDVIFFCAGHGEAKKFVAANNIPSQIKLIDIGNDFRLAADAEINGRKFIYGLPELQREEIKQSNNVANPGCFATAIQLGLLPLAKAGLLPEDINTTGITGSTGAGQSLSPTSHFSYRQNNISGYKTLTHQHNDEIQQSLHQLQNSFPASPKQGGLYFVPWRGDFTRGIFISSQVKCDKSLDELTALYTAYYAGHPFTTIQTESLSLKQVVNTNKCIIQLEKVGNRLVIHSIIDNLVKGASGQAVQNMNLIFGLDETTGLKLKANYF